MKTLLIFFLILLILALIYSIFVIIRLFKQYNNFLKKYYLLSIFVIICFVLILCLFKLQTLLFPLFLYFIMFSIIIDLFYIILKNKINDKLKRCYSSLLIPLGLSFIFIIYGFINVNSVIKTTYNLSTDKNVLNTKILYISDSHYGDMLKKNKLDKLKKKFDKVNADIVILGGDIVDEGTTKEEMTYIFSILGDIKNKYGIYFINGNHDRQKYLNESFYSFDEFNNVLESNNIIELKDSYIEIDNLVLIGREDAHSGRNELKNVLNEVDKNKYLITLDHQPLNYQENIDNDIDLIISGHTHAGQIFPGELVINLFKTSDLAYGYKNIGGLDAIVSSGVYGWGFPVRTSRHSEYVVINIDGGKNE